jgi:DNA-binding beta-propeller fold protein YncE
MLDTNTLKVAKRVEFPKGSRPWMLRASPDGREVWVQTASGSNVVLDARTLETLHTEELGEQPVTTAWSPDGRYNFVTHFADDWVAIMDPQSGKLVKRLEVGQNGANVSFRPDTASTAMSR